MQLNIKPEAVPQANGNRETIEEVLRLSKDAAALSAEEKYDEALAKIVDGLRRLREFTDYTNTEFRATLALLLFDLSEVHFMLKDYKQSEKDLETLFKVLENLTKEDPDRFGELHVLAMELSTRILRSRKKTMELLAKQQINTGVLYEKVNAGVAAATDKLVESLRKGAEMMAQTGDYKGAVRFYMEAIKLAKKRTGRVARREVRMTVDMARVMLHSKSETPRARRLLQAVLPHAVALEALDLEQEILAMIERIDSEVAHEPMWRNFMEKLQRTAKSTLSKVKKEKAEPENKEEKKEDAETEKLAETVEKEASEELKEEKKEEKKEKKAKKKDKKKSSKKDKEE